MVNSITDILNELQNISFEDAKSIGHWCDKLVAFYKSNERHSYSEITKYIIDGGGIDYIESIIPVLETLKNSPSIDADIKKKIGKLIDHLNLEVIRIRYINDLIVDKSSQVFINLNNDTIELVENAVGQLEEKNNNIGKSLEKTKKKIKNLQNESIAILGIFAAIMLAFVGGLTFSTSVLQNIHQASIYRISFIVIIIGIVLFNVIWVLITFILKISDNDLIDKKYFYTANGILIALILFVCVAYSFK